MGFRSELDKEYPTLNFERGCSEDLSILFHRVGDDGEEAVRGLDHVRPHRRFGDFVSYACIRGLNHVRPHRRFGDFGSYACGELIWVKTMTSLEGAFNGKVALHKKKAANKNPLESYSVYNFPFPFQVWAYEIVIHQWMGCQ
ncbi:hypothetical protein E6C27_scaffold154G002290 [Cucumis melo var. makuwa]|uniref:Uncharacterized protein n=1 Tax=Cucumis melo var. makuwa TaxID=1194695 RepID=A0A5A7V5B8_CUCMM|nr:hypothetical protein E6C27_scaffold154G002290 [Cucumis melo var. makuwa]